MVWCRQVTSHYPRQCWPTVLTTLRWRHNDHAGVSNHQPHGCLLNRLFRRKSKKTSKLRVTGLCAGNSPGTGEFPAQMTSYAENVSIWWRHHAMTLYAVLPYCISAKSGSSGAPQQQRKPKLERKCHFDEIFRTASLHQKLSFWLMLVCRQWWRLHQNDDIFVSVKTSFILGNMQVIPAHILAVEF